MTSNRRTVFAALICAGILWGTTVPLSKLALGWLPPASLAFIRFALAAAILLVICRGRLRAAVSPGILVSGGLGFGGSVVLQNFGIERTSVSHAALLIGATPVLVAVLAAAFRQGVARPAAWAGFGLSLAGVAVIAAGKGGGASAGGDGLVLLAQLGSAGFTVSQGRLLRGRDPLAVTAVQLLAAAVVTLPVALLTGGMHTGPASPVALLATAGLVVAGTVGPTALFAFGQSHVAADVAGAFLNLEPLVGAVLGIIVFADPVGPAQLAGGAAILAGIALSSLHVVRTGRRDAAGPAGLERQAGTVGLEPRPEFAGLELATVLAMAAPFGGSPGQALAGAALPRRAPGSGPAAGRGRRSRPPAVASAGIRPVRPGSRPGRSTRVRFGTRGRLGAGAGLGHRGRVRPRVRSARPGRPGAVRHSRDRKRVG
jgi:O-acetylserine/cysteine efflux transporter